MDYSRIFSHDASDHEVSAVFSSPVDEAEFSKALNQAISHIWTGSEKSVSSVGRVFSSGVSRFAKIMDIDTGKGENGGFSKEAVLANTDSEIESPGALEKAQLPKIAESPFGIEDGDDITNFTTFHRKSSSGASPEEKPNLADSVDVTENNEKQPFTEVDLTHVSTDGARVITDQDPFEELSEVQKTTAISNIADILTLWFSRVSKQAKKHDKDAFSIIFGPPGSAKTPNDAHLHALLAHSKVFIQNAIEQNDLERAGSLRKLIILIHEILHSLFVALTLRVGEANPNDVIVVKSLLFCFFQVDFSDALQALLDRTTGKKFPVPEEKSEENSDHGHLRLSYETVMKIYGIYLSLANCPIDLILVDKVSLSLDITTPEDTSPNSYTHALELLDFSDEKTLERLDTRLVAHLAAIFNYYYHLSPDILRHSLRHSSFFGWITGNALSSASYLSTNTTGEVTSFSDISLDPKDPFLYEVELYEHRKRIQYSKLAPESEFAVRNPSYLAITFQIFELLHNKEFSKHLTVAGQSDIALLDIWLCVSSYVHHYQYKSAVNTFGARVSLLLMLKLTSLKSRNLGELHDHKIDENTWKLCHHKHPVIPLDENCAKKDALLYMIDVLQVTFRYNLSKKLDLENAKIALTVLYQILLELEANPTEGLRTYAWNELYAALVKFVNFVSRSQNEEGVKYVIEEIFSVFQLLLSPVFDNIVEKTSDFFSLGYHPAKSMNFDLLYIMLQQRETLEALFDKFIKRRANFVRVEKAFAEFKEKLSVVKSTELHPDDVTRILNELSLSGKENSQTTTVKIDSFNYAETFKYCDKYRDYEDFGKQQELIRAFIAILETDWAVSEK